MTEEMVTVAVYGSPFEAGMARSELEAFGIPVYVADEFTIGANLLYSNALGGVKVNVPLSYAEEARQILSVEVPNENPSSENVINVHKEIAKSFVWLYLGLAAVSMAALICVFMTQN
ncbi:MAG: DUF2007 domain-containing protein [Desulfuromonadales bacterium]|nr:DUF2007 domain-containing protein [Desulfuromonadales bacterium]